MARDLKASNVSKIGVWQLDSGFSFKPKVKLQGSQENYVPMTSLPVQNKPSVSYHEVSRTVQCCETVQSLMHIMYRKYPGSPCSAVQLARRREVLWALCRYRVSVVFKLDPLVRLASNGAVQWSDTPTLVRKRGTGFVLMGHGVVLLLLVKTECSYGNMAINMPVRKTAHFVTNSFLTLLI